MSLMINTTRTCRPACNNHKLNQHHDIFLLAHLALLLLMALIAVHYETKNQHKSITTAFTFPLVSSFATPLPLSQSLLQIRVQSLKNKDAIAFSFPSILLRNKCQKKWYSSDIEKASCSSLHLSKENGNDTRNELRIDTTIPVNPEKKPAMMSNNTTNENLLIQTNRDNINEMTSNSKNTNTTTATTTTTTTPTEFQSLDIILEKARKRQMFMLFPYRAQAFLNKPLFQISILPSKNVLPTVITTGDIIFVLFAIQLNSIGFAVGYTIGKLTVQSLRMANAVPMALTELWTVTLAVILDVLWRNID